MKLSLLVKNSDSYFCEEKTVSVWPAEVTALMVLGVWCVREVSLSGSG